MTDSDPMTEPALHHLSSEVTALFQSNNSSWAEPIEREQHDRQTHSPSSTVHTFARLRTELELARAGCEAARLELAAQHADLDAIRLELTATQTQVAVRERQIEAQTAILLNDRAALNAARVEIDSQRTLLSTERAVFTAARLQLVADQARCEAERAELCDKQADFESCRRDLRAQTERVATDRAAVDAARVELDLQRTLLDVDRADLANRRIRLDATQVQLEAARAQLEAEHALCAADRAQILVAQAEALAERSRRAETLDEPESRNPSVGQSGLAVLLNRDRESVQQIGVTAANPAPSRPDARLPSGTCGNPTCTSSNGQARIAGSHSVKEPDANEVAGSAEIAQDSADLPAMRPPTEGPFNGRPQSRDEIYGVSQTGAKPSEPSKPAPETRRSSLDAFRVQFKTPPAVAKMEDLGFDLDARDPGVKFKTQPEQIPFSQRQCQDLAVPALRQESLSLTSRIRGWGIPAAVLIWKGLLIAALVAMAYFFISSLNLDIKR